ncbi:MAG: hypothetical protein ACXVAY_12725 [Mucilaginibacter sp.]
MYKNRLYKQLIVIGLLTSLPLLVAQQSYAQTRATGRLFEYQTRISLGGIKVENLKTHVIAVSDTGGRFSIRASAGDRLVFSALSYKTDTLYLTNLKFKEVYLELKGDKMLKGVTIVNKETNLGSMAVPAATPFGGKSVRYQTDASGNNKGGLALSLPGFNGDLKKKARDAKRERDGETETQIDRLFSPENLQKYIPIRDQQLANFILLYRPSVEVYQDKFNFMLYLDDCYKKFVKIPIEQRQAKDFMQLYKP